MDHPAKENDVGASAPPPVPEVDQQSAPKKRPPITTLGESHAEPIIIKRLIHEVEKGLLRAQDVCRDLHAAADVPAPNNTPAIVEAAAALLHDFNADARKAEALLKGVVTDASTPPATPLGERASPPMALTRPETPSQETHLQDWFRCLVSEGESLRGASGSVDALLGQLFPAITSTISSLVQADLQGDIDGYALSLALEASITKPLQARTEAERLDNIKETVLAAVASERQQLEERYGADAAEKFRASHRQQPARPSDALPSPAKTAAVTPTRPSTGGEAPPDRVAVKEFAAAQRAAYLDFYQRSLAKIQTVLDENKVMSVAQSAAEVATTHHGSVQERAEKVSALAKSMASAKLPFEALGYEPTDALEKTMCRAESEYEAAINTVRGHLRSLTESIKDAAGKASAAARAQHALALRRDLESEVDTIRNETLVGLKKQTKALVASGKAWAHAAKVVEKWEAPMVAELSHRREAAGARAEALLSAFTATATQYRSDLLKLRDSKRQVLGEITLELTELEGERVRLEKLEAEDYAADRLGMLDARAEQLGALQEQVQRELREATSQLAELADRVARYAPRCATPPPSTSPTPSRRTVKKRATNGGGDSAKRGRSHGSEGSGAGKERKAKAGDTPVSGRKARRKARAASGL